LKFHIYIKKKASKFDFNAIAQGYSVDVIADYLNSLGINNYMVEVGGELKTKGVNSKHEPWKIGIDKPIENSKPGEQEFQIIAGLTNKSLATSGNYRKFYEKDGIKYSHTINPKTGKPVQHQLLSTTVVTDNCALADAYATAFMVMGVDETKLFLKQHKDLNLSVYLIYSDSTSKWKTWQTENFDEIIVK
jgi:thiamine biosynthesis lipoprotein